jgi:CelD/BcsL family acetyltransferase involved in cellulose biosynthesis
LTAAQWRLWLDIQEGSPAYESPYFRPEFTQAVASVRSDVEVALIQEAGQLVGFFPFQRGKLNLGKPVGGKLSDYHGPLMRERAALDPLQLVRDCRLATWDFDHLVGPTRAFEPHITLREASPQIDLAEGFEAYVVRRKQAGSDTFTRCGQKLRKLAREVGPVTFSYDDEDCEAFESLQRWKSEQYKRTALTDVFAFPWTLDLLQRLREHRGIEFSAPLSVLRAGDKVAAVTLSLRSRGVLHSWFTAYNPELHTYSPGLLFYVRLAEEAKALGIRKIDLGRGDERYKKSLATGVIEVGEGTVACPTLTTWLRNGWRQTRHWVERSSLPKKLIQPVREWLAYK